MRLWNRLRDWQALTVSVMGLINYFKCPTHPVIACFIALVAMIQTGSKVSAATQSELVERCEACHGPGGDSQASSTPRLNGQQAEYLLDRLKALSEMSRANPHVDVKTLNPLANDGGKASVVEYFAGQHPTDPKPGTRAAEGKDIFESGVPAENVIACNLCHGANGEGHNVAPRLAGQHADYLKAQLVFFNHNIRQHGKANAEPTASGRIPFFGASPMYNAPMSANTKRMSQNTIDALASYLGND